MRRSRLDSRSCNDIYFFSRANLRAIDAMFAWGVSDSNFLLKQTPTPQTSLQTTGLPHKTGHCNQVHNDTVLRHKLCRHKEGCLSPSSWLPHQGCWKVHNKKFSKTIMFFIIQPPWLAISHYLITENTWIGKHNRSIDQSINQSIHPSNQSNPIQSNPSICFDKLGPWR